MAKAKGTPKTGGRETGTPNKTTVSMKEWIQGLVNDNLGQLKTDLDALEPKDRWAVVERLMQYCTPKMQSIDATVQIAEEYNQLERLLKNAPDKWVEKVVAKIQELKQTSKTVSNG